ncbi:hypothetical protein H6P81_011235 [Aristolochia fimbriata]|uniref:RRP15-like protein n=1 Tax=Aristolochia fimbriata TaxID=158543 RepID=A0AAV7ET53_ARIFI|nr:hypothetical protein H6P81_011235 [Aristolochia fimbriata]
MGTVGTQASKEAIKFPKKRKLGKKKGSKAKKLRRKNEQAGPKVRINRKLKQLYKKRAVEYNSDDEASEGEARGVTSDQLDGEGASSGDERPDDLHVEEEKGSSDEEEDEIEEGTRFAEGCRAFRMAFTKIMKTKISSDVLGPVLSAHKKLIAEKLAEEETERKVKGEAKKEKLLVREKGHVKPNSYLDTKDKFLISVATKGVVKLFNAVSKAQNAQKGLASSRSKDAKALGKQRKETFMSELRKPLGQVANDFSSKNFMKGTTSSNTQNDEEPGWAPLRDSYMLTDSKLKDWDKMPDQPVAVPVDGLPLESSSDED